MSAEIISMIQPVLKLARTEHVFYAAMSALEDALAANVEFMRRWQECKIDYPGEFAIPLGSFAHWLLEETERSGDASAAFAKLNAFIDMPRRTWQHAVVCTDVVAQIKGDFEPWQFSNGVVAYAAGLPPEYKIWINDPLGIRALVFLDQQGARSYSDFIECVTDCCRSLSFMAGEGCYLRPSFHTYAFETSAPYPLGSSIGGISSRKNSVLPLLTAELIGQADAFLRQMLTLQAENLALVRRVLDRHAGAVVWGTDIENRAIDARVCMEMILMRNSMGDNSFKVSRRAAYLMSDDPVQRLEILSRAKTLYDAGSHAVHGGSLQGMKQKDLDRAGVVRNCHDFLGELVSAWIAREARDMKDEDWAVVEVGGAFPR